MLYRLLILVMLIFTLTACTPDVSEIVNSLKSKGLNLTFSQEINKGASLYTLNTADEKTEIYVFTYKSKNETKKSFDSMYSQYKDNTDKNKPKMEFILGEKGFVIYHLLGNPQVDNEVINKIKESMTDK